MSSASTFGGPPGTLGSMAAEVTRWMRGDLLDDDGQAIIRDAINDAISSIWMAGIKIKLARFMGATSPVTLLLAANTERQQLITIPDPTVAPVTTTFVGGNLPGPRTYTIGFTLVTDSGTETNMSPTVQQVVAAGSLLQMNEPNAAGQLPPAPLPPGIIGFNVYAGQNYLALQNQQPVPLAGGAGGYGMNWQEPPAGIQDYPAFQTQPPISNTTGDNISWIEHMEALMPDGTHIAWNQSSIDSEMMRRLTRIFPSASPYQTYAWDLLNGNSIEIRPVLGIAFTNRYWFISKPRRLRYDQARIPYQEMTGVWEFVRRKAISGGKLSLEEYLAQQAWETQADKSLGEFVEALNQENWALDVRVTPYLYG